MSLDEGPSQLPPGASGERRLWLALVEQAAGADRLKAELNTMRNSLSWRITAPLRALRALWSRGRPTAPELLAAAPPPKDEEALHEIPSSWITLCAVKDDVRRQWFADVTELAREDLGAGVERVTRRLLSELLLAPPVDARVQPVRLASNGEYVCANAFLARFLGLPPGVFGVDGQVQPRPGDQFVGLDFCRNHAALMRGGLRALRVKGVVINLLVHDVLPLTHPEWFPSGVPEAFAAWLQVLGEVSHRALCDSQQTAEELAATLTRKGISAPDLLLDVIPLGADLPPAPDVPVLPPRREGVIRVLTVGTIEPRKGHGQALKAFEALWARGSAMEWVIAGKAGWNVEALVARLQTHGEFGRRLHWMNGPDDRELSALYRECDILLSPSLGEGFGLPVAEAGLHGMPLVLRDIPVFREVAGDRASFFSGLDPESIERALVQGREAMARERRVIGSWATWAQSASRLKELCVPVTDAQSQARS